MLLHQFTGCHGQWPRGHPRDVGGRLLLYAKVRADTKRNVECPVFHGRLLTRPDVEVTAAVAAGFEGVGREFEAR